MDFRIFTEPQNGATYEDQLAMAQAAEKLGFGGFFRSDHYLTIVGPGGIGPTDAWTTLAALARETSRIALGTMVSSVTFRHPGILAIQVAQVDAMSGGRAELGIGAGWYKREHEAYGIPFPAKRFGLWEEQLQILTGLWSTPSGETFSFQGEHYSLVNAPALPKPARLPIPLIVGGSGPKKTPRLAATYATEYNAGFATVSELGPKIERVRQACAVIGRDPATLVLSVAATTATGPTEAIAQRRAAASGSDLTSLRHGGLAGSAAEVVDKIGVLRELGFSRLYFQLMDMRDLDQLDFLAREVVPQLG